MRRFVGKPKEKAPVSSLEDTGKRMEDRGDTIDGTAPLALYGQWARA